MEPEDLEEIDDDINGIFDELIERVMEITDNRKDYQYMQAKDDAYEEAQEAIKGLFL